MVAGGSNGAEVKARRAGGSVSRPPLSFLGLPLLVALLAVLAAVLILRGEPRRPAYYGGKEQKEQNPLAQVEPTLGEDEWSMTSTPAASATRAPSPDRTPIAEQPGVELRVEATEETWLSVSADGGESVGMLLKPGDKRMWRALEGFELTVGNAGGVKLVLDGVELSPLGSPGQVIRGLELPAGWRRGRADR